MEEKVYHFYVLFEESDPDNIKYVGVTTRKIEERFSQQQYQM